MPGRKMGLPLEDRKAVMDEAMRMMAAGDGKQEILDYCHENGCDWTWNYLRGEASTRGIKRPAAPAVSLDLKGQLLKTLKKGSRLSLVDLSVKLDVPCGPILTALEGLRGQGYNIEMPPEGGALLSRDIAPSPPIDIPLKYFYHNEIRIGICSDNHLGSRYERLDVLNALYDLFEQEEVPLVLNAGNIVDGESDLNRYDIHVHGLDNQVNYLVQQWPFREGIETRFITGDCHEGWWVKRNGIDIGRKIAQEALAQNRPDIQYLAHLEADLMFPAEEGETWVRVFHPGGGSSYAHSYALQKIVESYQGGEKPQVLIVGHYHKLLYDCIRNVHSVMAGCTQDQTPFMRKNKLDAHVGGMILWLNQAPDGSINRCRVEVVNFFDRGFYKKYTVRDN